MPIYISRGRFTSDAMPKIAANQESPTANARPQPRAASAASAQLVQSSVHLRQFHLTQRAPYGLALSDGNGGKVAYPDRIGQSSSISHLLCGARHLLLVLPCASRR